MLPGNEKTLMAHLDRTLLFVMPYRPGNFGPIIEAWRGPRLAVVARSVFPFAPDGWNPDGTDDEAQAIESGGWVREWERDLPPHGLSSPSCSPFGEPDAFCRIFCPPWNLTPVQSRPSGPSERWGSGVDLD